MNTKNKKLILILFIFLFLSQKQTKASNPELIIPPPSCATLITRSQFEEILQKNLSKKPLPKHRDENGQPLYTNRLALESSFYLQSHAYNPINWYPWGEKAFRKARELKRPVFLSIGYFSCHWCHVMEEQSFENLEIAAYLNENFISIKVDAEERPDVNSLYMKILISILDEEEESGWPMTLFLNPDQKVFFGGTYFTPKELLKSLKRVKDIYDNKLDSTSDNKAQVSGSLEPTQAGSFNEIPQASSSLTSNFDFKEIAEMLKRAIDPIEGGMTGEEKFPTFFPLHFLLRQIKRSYDRSLLRSVLLTMKKMASGGIYDQIGGGFHRYSTDPFWVQPHYEKRLSDNALLIPFYLETHLFMEDKFNGDENWLNRDNVFRQIVEDILNYVEREMSSNEKAFYSSTDADSIESESGIRLEGHFFTWSLYDLQHSGLTEEEISFVKVHYNLPEPDLTSPTQQHILHTLDQASGHFLFVEEKAPTVLEETANFLNIDHSKASQLLASSKEKMYNFRLLHKFPPHRDEKIILSWNALMISAFAMSGFALNEKAYLERAKESAGFILTHMLKEGRLLRTFHQNSQERNSPHRSVPIFAQLEDYALFVSALLSLYEYTGNQKWLEQAMVWDRVLRDQFEDEEKGGFFRTARNQEKLILREKSFNDTSFPSGNSVHTLNLLRLYHLTYESNYLERAEKIIKRVIKDVQNNPFVFPNMLVALDFYFTEIIKIVIVTPENKSGSEETFLNKIRNKFIPNKVLSIVSEGESIRRSQEGLSLFKGKKAPNQKPTAYVCKGKKCYRPIQDPEEFLKLIEHISSSEEEM